MKIPSVALLCCCCCTHALLEVSSKLKAGLDHVHSDGKPKFYMDGAARSDDSHEILKKSNFEKLREENNVITAADDEYYEEGDDENPDDGSGHGHSHDDDDHDHDEGWSTAQQWGYATLANTFLGPGLII